MLVRERMLSVFSTFVIGNFKKSPALLANSLQKSCLAIKAVFLPKSNCKAVER